jgi:hypothetical protein
MPLSSSVASSLSSSPSLPFHGLRTLQHDLEEIRKGDEGYAVRPGSLAGNLGLRSSDTGSDILSAIEGEKVLQSQFSDILRVSAGTAESRQSNIFYSVV